MEMRSVEANDENQKYAFGYLTQQEVRFLDAAVARLIPADEELGPGAKEAGVTYFIDQQLISSWGTHGRNYRFGPWREGTPQQGFQSPLTPQEIYRAAIREINTYCLNQYGKPFHMIGSDHHDRVLHGIEDDEIALESIKSSVFFALLLRNTIEGFFSDPMYGGNRNKIGWRLINFPGVAPSTYGEHIQDYGVPYRVEPVSILDVTQNRVQTDAQGYPKHAKLNK